MENPNKRKRRDYGAKQNDGAQHGIVRKKKQRRHTVESSVATKHVSDGHGAKDNQTDQNAHQKGGRSHRTKIARASSFVMDRVPDLRHDKKLKHITPDQVETAVEEMQGKAVMAEQVPYIEATSLSNLNQETIDQYLIENHIKVQDHTVTQQALYRPLIKFSYLPSIGSLRYESLQGFKTPTPIQAAAWPFLLSGRDVVGIAETGSGKTLAFAVPCINAVARLLRAQPKPGPKALIISPTRELAMQSYRQISELVGSLGIQAACVYGGVAKEQQRATVGASDILVATPGRLIDLINEGYADLRRVIYLVLDEADRMLDKGFEDDVRKIVSTTSTQAKRQTLMFTATWPECVRTLAATFMSNPVKIFVGNHVAGDLRANSRIVQKVEVVEPRNKEQRLLQLLKKYQISRQQEHKILVFCLYKKEAIRVEGYIRSKGFFVASIHGDLSQDHRTRSLEGFKQGVTSVLVATDVAARGLDIPDVNLVINCTFPLTVEDYVHRIGRTGRAGKEGLAITLFTEHDKAHSGSLINVLKAANQEIPSELLRFGTTVKKKEHSSYGAFFKNVDTSKSAQKIKFD